MVSYVVGGTFKFVGTSSLSLNLTKVGQVVGGSLGTCWLPELKT